MRQVSCNIFGMIAPLGPERSGIQLDEADDIRALSEDESVQAFDVMRGAAEVAAATAAQETEAGSASSSVPSCAGGRLLSPVSATAGRLPLFLVRLVNEPLVQAARHITVLGELALRLLGHQFLILVVLYEGEDPTDA